VSAGSVAAVDEDYRVEVDLDDEAHGFSLRERLQAVDLDEAARDRLGSDVVVTRDDARMFLYADTEESALAASHVVEALIAAEELTADIRITRWHPVEEEWLDLSVPLPETLEEEEAEYEAREASEVAEATHEGWYDWRVVVHLPTRERADELAAALSAEDLPVRRRWRWVIVGVPTEERAEALEERLQAELPDDADVRVDVDLSDVAHSPLQFFTIW
jgi:hypothetical protein